MTPLAPPQKKSNEWTFIQVIYSDTFLAIHAICSQIRTWTSGLALCVFHVFKSWAIRWYFCVFHCQGMLPTLVSKSLPFTSEAGQEEEQNKHEQRGTFIVCFKMGLIFKISWSLRKNRFRYVAAWLFFNAFFTHDLTTWEKQCTHPWNRYR